MFFPVCPCIGMVEVDCTSISGCIVGQHGGKHYSCVFHIDGTTVYIGIVVVYQRIENSSSFQVDRTSVSGGIIFCHRTVLQIGIQSHVHSGAPVGGKVVHAHATLCVSAFDGYSVEDSDEAESFFSFRDERGKPHYVARVAGQCPTVAAPGEVVGIGCTYENGWVLEFP